MEAPSPEGLPWGALLFGEGVGDSCWEQLVDDGYRLRWHDASDTRWLERTTI